jgi:hypothetical protein
MVGMNISETVLEVNPLDVVEQFVDHNEWIFDRRGDHEMTVSAPGRWCHYSLFFSWNATAGAMHFTCAFDMRIPEEKRHMAHELLTLINSRMWLGHFGIWEDEGLPIFRYALPLRGAKGPSAEMVEDLLETAISECERFYPTFQYVIWGGKTAAEAISSTMVDTVGEA